MRSGVGHVLRICTNKTLNFIGTYQTYQPICDLIGAVSQRRMTAGQQTQRPVSILEVGRGGIN